MEGDPCRKAFPDPKKGKMDTKSRPISVKVIWTVLSRPRCSHLAECGFFHGIGVILVVVVVAGQGPPPFFQPCQRRVDEKGGLVLKLRGADRCECPNSLISSSWASEILKFQRANFFLQSLAGTFQEVTTFSHPFL